MSVRLLGNLIDRFNDLEKKIDEQHMDVEKVNELVTEARQLWTDTNRAITFINKADCAQYAEHAEKAMVALAILANRLDSLKQTPKLS